MYLTNVTLENNTAANGGAIATDSNNTGGAGVRDGLIVKNCEIRNNTASEKGGAFYIWKGRPLHMYDSKVTGNTASLEGGAIWSYEDVQLHDSTITGNTSGGEGYAVYMNDANYDGHSYYSSKNKLSGDVVIKDNNGGNLWMGPDVVFVITTDGLGQNAHIELELDSGFVTNRILGAYHYEGGEQLYTITYGDKSMTDPEYDASLAYKGGEQEQKKAPAADVLLYVGIGVIGLAAIAAVVLIATKKKKSAPAEKN
jgi:predicted outer membrane repeat protein